MEEKTSIWPYILRYGTMMGLVSVIITILSYMVNPDLTDPGSAVGITQSIATALNIGIFLYIATKTYRDQELEGLITYGKSVGFAVAMALPLIIISGIYTFIFFGIIDPEFMSRIMEKQAEKLAEKGLSDEDIERSMQVMGYMSKPAVSALFSMISLFFETLIIGLITSIFTQKQPATTADH